jgi:hypothetical protein
VFKGGVERYQNQRRVAAESAAAAEAVKKAGIMGKAKNVFGAGSKGSTSGAPPNGLGECVFRMVMLCRLVFT